MLQPKLGESIYAINDANNVVKTFYFTGNPCWVDLKYIGNDWLWQPEGLQPLPTDWANGMAPSGSAACAVLGGQGLVQHACWSFAGVLCWIPNFLV